MSPKANMQCKIIPRLLSNTVIAVYSLMFAMFSASAQEVIHIEVGDRSALSTMSVDSAAIQVKFINDLQSVLDRLGQNQGRSKLVDISIAPGTHRLSHSIQLSHERNPFAGIRFHGPSTGISARVVGTRIFQLPRVDENISSATIPLTAAQGNGYLNQLYGFDKPIHPHVVQVFSNGHRLAPMRWPLDTNTRIDEVLDRDDYFVITLAASTKASARWPNLIAGTPIRLSGYFGSDYAFESVPGTIVSERQIRILKKGLRYGIKTGSRVFVENVFQSDGRSGFVVDRDANELRVIAESGATIELPIVEGFLRAEGIRNLNINNLELFGYTGDAVVLRGAEESSLNEVSIKGTGNRAIVIEGRHVSVRNSRLDDLGEGGISVAGGNRTDLSRGDNVISKTVITHFDVLARTYRPAVQIDGVGNSVIDSTLTDGNHSAIIFSGNDHTIANNRIARVTQDGYDSGAIYAGRDWTTYGTVIEKNLFEDNHNILPNQKSIGMGIETVGIYLDDGISGIVIRENVFVDTPWAVFINGGKDNFVGRNIFIRSSPPVGASGYLLGHPEYLKPTAELQVILSELAIAKSLLLERHPAIWQNRYLPEILKPTGNVIVNNIFVNSGDVRYDNSKNKQFYFANANMHLQLSQSRLTGLVPSQDAPELIFQAMWQRLCENNNLCIGASP